MGLSSSVCRQNGFSPMHAALRSKNKDWSARYRSLMCPGGAICLPTDCCFLYQTPTSLLVEKCGGDLGFIMSIENPIIFTQQVDQTYCDTCMR